MSIQHTPFFFRSRARIILLIAILLIVTILAVALPLVIYRTQSQQLSGAANVSPQSFVVGAGTLLILKEQSGNISVYPSHTHTITVTPRKSGTTVAPSAQSVHILYTQGLTAQGHEQITVSTDPWFSNTDFLVTIPDTTAVQIAISSGNIDVHGGNGLSASTNSGSVELDHIQGSVTVQAESGDVTATDLNGPLAITDSSGSLRLQGVKGQLKAQTWSGDVLVNDAALSGNSQLQTQNGSVRFSGSLDPHGTYKMQTSSGDVDLSLPDNAAFTLEASTGSGSVTNDFGANVVGVSPRASLQLQTQHGSITVVKSA